MQPALHTCPQSRNVHVHKSMKAQSRSPQHCSCHVAILIKQCNLLCWIHGLRLILAVSRAETCGWLNDHVYVKGYWGQITWDCFAWLRYRQHIVLLLLQNKPGQLVVCNLRRCRRKDQETRSWVTASAAPLQTEFRLTCGSSQSAEYNLAGLVFLLSTSQRSRLIWCDMADTTLKAAMRPCWWLIQAQKTWWGLALCVYPCRHLNSGRLSGMTLGCVIRLNHRQWMMLMWKQVEARLRRVNPEKWLSTTTIYLHAV